MARMPRKPRLFIPGGIYHVVLRGNSRQPIFLKRRDRDLWETLLSESLDRHACRLHAYCWMTNHVHMAVQVSEQPLGNLIRWLASQYARRFNRMHKRSGHLFERRHRAILVDADRYLLGLIRYIHLNPVRAHMVDVPCNYRWSSHNAYLGKCSSQWLSKQLVFSLLGPDPNRAGKGYVNLMASDAETPAIVREGNESDSRLAGDDDFLARILGAETTSKGKGSLQEIVASYCTKESISQSELLATGRKRKYSRARALIAIEAVGTGSVTVSELARLFNRTESAICQVMNRYGTLRKPPNNQ